MMFPARRLALTTALVLVAGACAPAAQPTATPAAAPKATAAASPKPAVSPAASPSPAGGADQGKALIAAKGCGGCHTIPGVDGAVGTVGPNLQGVASRTKIAGGAVNNNGPEDLKKWIMDPPAAKPGTAMPNLNLSDDDATKIVAYLETLK